MPDEEQASTAEPRKSKKLKTLIVLGAVVLAEGALIFGVMKIVGFGAAPASASAGDEESTDGEEADGAAAIDGLAEVEIAETDAFNNRSGRLYMYHIQVCALVHADKQEDLTALIERRGSTVGDRINTVIRGADPKHLNEPGLETLRRQIKFELDKVLGDDSIIVELLIPRLLQSRTNL